MILNSNARPGSRVATVARVALVLALGAAVAGRPQEVVQQPRHGALHAPVWGVIQP